MNQIVAIGIQFGARNAFSSEIAHFSLKRRNRLRKAGHGAR